MNNKFTWSQISQDFHLHLLNPALGILFFLAVILTPANWGLAVSPEQVFVDIRQSFVEMNAAYLGQYLSQDDKIFFSFPVLEIHGNLFSPPHFLNFMQESVFKEVQTISFSFSDSEPVAKSRSSAPLLKRANWTYLMKKNNKRYRSELLFCIETRSGNYTITRIHTAYTQNL